MSCPQSNACPSPTGASLSILRSSLPCAPGVGAAVPLRNYLAALTSGLLVIGLVAIGLTGGLSRPAAARAAEEAARPATQILVLPAQVKLTGRGSQQSLLVERHAGPIATGDLTATAKYSSANPAIAEVDAKGQVTARGTGETQVLVELDQNKLTVPVRVEQGDAPRPVSFRHDVQTVLTRAGCNMGACHGAQAGKKGFKLTLRGYDHERDFTTLTRQSRGRRVSTTEPDSSLLLQKAIGEIPHSGGIRFDDKSEEYRLLRDWIVQGAAGPSRTDPVVTQIEILPKLSQLTPGQKQPLLVIAHDSDGRQRDVTHWSKFTSTEIGVASVDEEGVVTVTGTGEAAITVWFASKVTFATISVPGSLVLPPETFTQSERRNFVDEHVLAKLESLRIPPSGQATDEEYLRRVYVLTLGVLPSANEHQAFQSDRDPDKRNAVLERLFNRPEYVDYWAYKWCDLLLVSTKKLKGPAVWSFASWVREQVAQNRPWDQFARELMTARGSTLENGAANFYVLHKDPKLLTEATTTTFLGFSINCAQCHDHPLERWTLDDYYGMANLFARVRLKDGTSEGEAIVLPVADGEILHPTRSQTPPPRPLDGRALALSDPADRRQHLAMWLTAAENPYFARAIVNRVWANYMGRGLVEMVDDMRLTNPPSNAALLDALSADFVAHGYDLQHLIRTIVRSAAFQRSARMLPGNQADDRFYSHYLVRRLPAEVMLDTLSQVLDVPSEFPDYPKGLRALQLPDTNVTSYFLSAFGRPQREFTCECERSAEPNVTQTLHLANGKTLNDKLKAAGGKIDRWLDSGRPDAEIVDELFRSALTRAPTPAELEKSVALLQEAAATAADDQQRRNNRRQLLEDLCWAVLTSKEFLFVH